MRRRTHLKAVRQNRRWPVSSRHRYHDWDERRKWQNPEEILASLGLAPADVFADIGCGDGFFSLPAARIVGRHGRVYGVDTDGEALGDLRLRADEEGLGNLTLTAGRAETFVPCEGCADLVFFGIDLHDFQDPGAVLAKARTIIKTAGLLADLDWRDEPMDIGPPPDIRFSVQKASEMIERAGFTLEAVRESGPMHYLITARPGT
jgi:ubiquinone/menaquinone biosynthesis C-methylase UbiE